MLEAVQRVSTILYLHLARVDFVVEILCGKMALIATERRINLFLLFLEENAKCYQ